MASLSRLVATSLSSFALLSSSVSTANLTTYSSLRFLSNSFSSPFFNLLRVVRRCFSWSSVCDDLFFSSCSFFGSPSCSIFSRLILSLSLLCSSVYEALFALSFSFLSERCFFSFFFVNAKAALAYVEIRKSQVVFNRPDEG